MNSDIPETRQSPHLSHTNNTLVSSGPQKILTLAATPRRGRGVGCWRDRASPLFRQTLCRAPLRGTQVQSATEHHRLEPPACPLCTLSNRCAPTNADTRENRSCSGQRPVALSPQTQMSTEVPRVGLLVVRVSATHASCSTAPTATLPVHTMAKEYEQGRIRTEVLFLTTNAAVG